MNKVLTNLSTLALCLFTMAACTSETEKLISDDPSTLPDTGNDPTRREVVMALKNTLNITTSDTKAGGPATKSIATEEENFIFSLNVYVFGSATEDGEYTFQEHFAYGMPVGIPGIENAQKMDIIPGAENNQYNVVLRIKKGLFVKLYAVANSPFLGDGIHGTENIGAVDKPDMYMAYADYKPLSLANPGTTGTTVQTPGIPTEKEFLTYHNMLEPNAVKQFLPMTGACTTPLDLTDFSVFARLQTEDRTQRRYHVAGPQLLRTRCQPQNSRNAQRRRRYAD